MIRQIFGILFIEKSRNPLEIINLNDFKIEKILESAIKCFDFEKLIKCFQYCSKKKEDELTYTCDGLKEAVYQYELGSIFRGWFPIDINVCVQATKQNLQKYADIFLYCDKFKIVLELLSSERFTHQKNKFEADSSVLGHITRTILYGERFKAEPWIINFVTIKNIKDFDEIKYPKNDDINVVYIFHDKNFDNIIMKFKKKNEETKVIDIKKKKINRTMNVFILDLFSFNLE